MTQNQIAYWQMQETIQANRNREAETLRSNLAQEALKDYANKVTEKLGYGNLNELIMSHRNTEKETNRHNLAVENLDYIKNLINQYTAETGRLNVGLGYANLAELTRSHMADEAIKTTANTNQYLRDRENYAVAQKNANENIQHNRNVEEEAHRNNVTNQLLNAYSLLNDINLGTAKVGISALNGAMQPINSYLGKGKRVSYVY